MHFSSENLQRITRIIYIFIHGGRRAWCHLLKTKNSLYHTALPVEVQPLKEAFWGTRRFISA
jgi:hypothetical protein